MAFSFGFHDADEDDVQEVYVEKHDGIADNASINSNAVPVMEHKLEDLVVKIESPTGRLIYLPKRELYDVRVQLLLEGPTNDSVIDQIEKSDLRSGVYEGGFKTWECSLDLAGLLLDRGPRKDIDELIRCDQIIEHCLKNDIPMRFYLADFNAEVLRLVTLPNIILTWAACSSPAELSNLDANSKADLELTPELLQRFTTDMHNVRLDLHFLSGPWSLTLADLIPQSGSDMGSVILAAETIYSPDSTAAFVDLLANMLKRVKMSKAMIAAKRMYFGVGGSVDGLKEACREEGMVAYEIENHGVPGMEVGVGRALIEVQMY
nr:histidine protein methyltransferase 1 [Quercus suber]